MAMRSMWMLFLIVMFPFQVAGWTQNRDAMDLAIGIHYANTKPSPVVVIHTIKWLADNLALGGNNTNVAIVDFRDNVNVLLKLNEGVSAAKVREACDKIGQGSYGTANTMSMSKVAEETRDRIDWSTDPLRSHLPRVVLVFWEVGMDFSGGVTTDHERRRQLLMNEALEAKHAGAGFVFLNHFDGSGWPIYRDRYTDFWVIFPVFGAVPFPMTNFLLKNEWDTLASRSAEAIRKSVGMCWYTWNPQHDCYMHVVHGCVQNIAIDLKFDNGTHTTPVWDDLLPFCFKTATIYPCAGTCPETTKSTTITTTRKSVTPVTTGPARISTSIKARSTTSASGAFETTQEEQPTTTEEEPASSNSAVGTDDGDSSIVAVGVGIACGLIILIAVVITVFLVIKCKKKKGAGGDKSKSKSKKATSTKKSVAFPSRSQSLGPAEWSYAKPPELSQTPPSILVKQYMTKKK